MMNFSPTWAYIMGYPVSKNKGKQTLRLQKGHAVTLNLVRLELWGKQPRVGDHEEKGRWMLFRDG